MKINLTPQISYLAGLCKFRKSRDGIGVRGPPSLITAFSSHVVSSGIMPPQKIILKGSEAKFFHTSYSSLLKRTYENEADIFKHHNDYAASFLAGLFDAKGGFAKGAPIIEILDRQDLAVLENLNFRCAQKNGVWFIGPKDQFLLFIKNYRQRLDSELEGKEKIEFDFGAKWGKRENSPNAGMAEKKPCGSDAGGKK